MAAFPLRWRPLVLVGLVSGLAHVVAGAAMYLSGVYFERWALGTMMLLLAACIAAGNWWYGKHVLAGHTTYWKALLGGVVISAVTGLVYITYNFVSVSFLYANFLDQMVEAGFRQLSAGMDAAAAARLLDSLRAETTLGSLMIGNLLAVCRLGTLFSLVISLGFLKRWRRAGQQAAVRV